MVDTWRAREDAAVIAQGTVWSGSELLERSAGAVDHLTELADQGGPIPALITSTPGALAYVMGGAQCGRPLAPLGPRLTANELRPCVEGLNGAVILTEEAFTPLAREVAEATGCRVEVIAVPPRAKRPPGRSPLPGDTAFVLHTSGTTGQPKAVAYRQDRLAIRTAVNARLCALHLGAVYATASPFHHIAGLGNYAVALAGGVTLAPLPRFTVESWKALSDRHVTHALTVPTVLEMLLEAGALGLPHLEVLQYGASPIHPDTLRRALEAVPDVALVNLYGQTEGSPVTCLTSEDHRRIALGGRDGLLASVGRAAPGVELIIPEPDDQGIGEVVARAEHFFAPDEDGWLRTGDLGRLDNEGYLYLVGRSDDKIIRGGENVYPLEIERVLELHPAVHEAAVTGIADRRLGERVKAYVVPEDPSRPPDEDDLRAHVRRSLAGFKVPADWEFVAALERNASGKLIRRSLGSLSAKSVG